MQHQCIVCNNKATFLCAHCGLVPYCSSQCKEQDYQQYHNDEHHWEVLYNSGEKRSTAHFHYTTTNSMDKVEDIEAPENAVLLGDLFTLPELIEKRKSGGRRRGGGRKKRYKKAASGSRYWVKGHWRTRRKKKKVATLKNKK